MFLRAHRGLIAKLTPKASRLDGEYELELIAVIVSVVGSLARREPVPHAPG